MDTSIREETSTSAPYLRSTWASEVSTYAIGRELTSSLIWKRSVISVIISTVYPI